MKYKIAGLGHLGGKYYKFGVVSPSDPNPEGLGYFSYEEAKVFADRMNKALETFEISDDWNKEYWKIKPEPFIVFEV